MGEKDRANRVNEVLAVAAREAKEEIAFRGFVMGFRPWEERLTDEGLRAVSEAGGISHLGARALEAGIPVIIRTRR